jgi:hypothetical protein
VILPKLHRLNLNNHAPINDLRIQFASNVTSASFYFIGHLMTFDTTSAPNQETGAQKLPKKSTSVTA